MDEVIERANNTTYGLAAGILTKNLENAMIFSQAVEAGSVWVNCFLAVTPQAPVSFVNNTFQYQSEFSSPNQLKKKYALLFFFLVLVWWIQAKWIRTRMCR